MSDFLYKWTVIILSIPMILFYLTIHIHESVMMNVGDYKDKVFMKRFNLIDQKHVHDFIKWNRKYCEDRDE